MSCQHSNCIINSNDTHNDKRIVSCNSPYCNFTCHVKCAGLAIKKQKDLETIYFVCKKCEEFLKFSSTFITEKITALENQVINRIDEIKCDVEKLANRISALEQEQQLKVDTQKFDKLCEKVESLEIKIISEAKNDIYKKAATQPNSNENPTVEKEPMQTNNLKYFLCSIETVLSISDINLILNDASVKTDGITLLEAEGDFRFKKYVVINFNSALSLFQFRTTFEKSNLHGIWFLTNKKPKWQRRDDKTTYVQEQRHTHFVSSNNAIAQNKRYANNKNTFAFNKYQNEHRNTSSSNIRINAHNNNSNYTYKNIQQPNITRNNSHYNGNVRPQTYATVARQNNQVANISHNSGDKDKSEQVAGISFLEKIIRIAKNT